MIRLFRRSSFLITGRIKGDLKLELGVFFHPRLGKKKKKRRKGERERRMLTQRLAWTRVTWESHEPQDSSKVYRPAKTAIRLLFKSTHVLVELARNYVAKTRAGKTADIIEGSWSFLSDDEWLRAYPRFIACMFANRRFYRFLGLFPF